MTGVKSWRAENPRGRLYLAVRATGTAGMSRKELLRALDDVAVGEITNLLCTLKGEGYIRAEKLPGKPSRYRVDGRCRNPKLMYGAPLPLLLDLIHDCDAGVSERVLCDELCVDALLVRDALKPAVSGAQVVMIYMPAAHGGGLGYRATP